MGRIPRRPKTRNPLQGLRQVSKDFRRDEAAWSNGFATRKDVSEIVEAYLNRYDEMVIERWWFRAKVPGRWIKAVYTKLHDLVVSFPSLVRSWWSQRKQRQQEKV